MDIFSDFKFWLFLISLCQTGLMTYGFIIIKFNDFKHLTKDVKEISTNVKELSCKVINIDKEISVQAEKIKTLEKAIE